MANGGKNIIATKSVEALEHIRHSILLLRGKQVLLDFQLAAMYGVETKVLNQAVKRNKNRFPEDFMFRLEPQEVAWMRSQFVTTYPQGSSRSSKAQEKSDWFCRNGSKK